MRIVFAFLLLFVLPQLAGAQKTHQWKQASAAGYTYRYVTNDPMGTRFYTLKNGLSVILSRNTKEPRVAVRIAVRTGSNNDPENHTGLAHYLEHLLFKGTNQYGSLDWAKEKPLLARIENLYEEYGATGDEAKRKEIYRTIDSVSGEAAKFAIAGEYDKMMKFLGSKGTNAHTFVEETVYEEDIPSNAIDKFLAIQSERFRNPVFRLFHTELEAVYEEKNRGLDNDNNKMQEAMFASLFPTHNYGLQTTIGTIEHLKNPSITAIENYYKGYYVPNNMAIIMAGDFNPDELIKKIDHQFAYMQAKPVKEYRGPEQVPINGPIVKEVYGPSAESVRVLFRSAAAGTRDAMLADLAATILSNGKAGLIDLNLNKQQKVLNAGSALWQFKDYGIFFLMAAPRQGQSLEDARSLLEGQVNDLKAGNFDAALIAAIVANYKLNRLQSLENNTARVYNLTDQFIKNRGREWDKDIAMVDAMSRVTKKELVAFANRFFTAKNYVVLYKRQGQDQSIVKVEKPPITPVQTNPGKTSPFVAAITGEKLPSIKPVWVDYSKDLQQTNLGDADLLYTKNRQNELFQLSYRFEMGEWNKKLLPVAARYLQYLGTDSLTSQEISSRFYDLACSFNFNTGNEESTVSVSGLGENFREVAALLEYLVKNCRPDEKALEALKANLLKARANAKLNKSAIAQGLQLYAMYGAHNPFNYTLSDAEIQSLKARDLTALLHELFSYRHRITYYGPLDIAALKNQLQPLHPLPSQWTPAPGAVKFTRTAAATNKVLFANYDAVQAEIYWVKNLSAYDPKEEALVNLFNSYFGGGMGSVVFSTIRESKALAYSTWAMVATPAKKEDPFSFLAYVGCQADKMKEAVASMNELLNALPESKEGFENARVSLVKNTETSRINADAIITSYLNAQRKGVDRDLRRENYAMYNKLSWNDVKTFHQQYLSGKPYTYCVIASDQKVRPDDLEKYGELKVLSLEEIFGY